ncbi:anthranilate synthase component I family protein [Microbacterium sp. SORGH_AS_0862]|uniref:anthranilate synthase component I family protein n=1 Tax=Microbacterium sp. SORGH_AS_0862 TaxID=3041789 RepID=UPI00278D323C|nr:anthranilate synthase component I family protein [Microbacterium sp. SORGH_AS_0862]MDQ1203692.1 para-aminobenzoate synthetase component 1 [Microbacterium sp. SORGH_AS_0862]
MPAAPVRVHGANDPAAVHALFAERDHTFWLDAGPDAGAGYSWIGSGIPVDGAEVRAVQVAAGDTAPHPAGPFRSGWVGWLSYEVGADAAGAPVAPDDMPRESWMRVRTLVTFDHAAGVTWVSGEDADAWAERITSATPVAPAAVPDRGAAIARVDASRYADDIRTAIAAIGRGDAYLLCLTTRFDVVGEVDALDAYAALRADTPSHHGLLIRSGGIALAGASPERFLLARDGRVSTHPIKGTRPRGATPEADAALAAELAADPKERAENVMIVDLMRNDLARVCDPATVSVDRLLEVETYPRVHQLVSSVSGVPHPGVTLGEMLKAVFPAGSMTGAPKLSAMTLLHDIEGAPRGAFSGCAGWVGDDGAFDLAMTIRTLVTHPRGAYVGAGGGITWSSEVAAEVAEVALKATAPLRAAGATLPADWGG